MKQPNSTRTRAQAVLFHGSAHEFEGFCPRTNSINLQYYPGSTNISNCLTLFLTRPCRLIYHLLGTYHKARIPPEQWPMSIRHIRSETIRFYIDRNRSQSCQLCPANCTHSSEECHLRHLTQYFHLKHRSSQHRLRKNRLNRTRSKIFPCHEPPSCSRVTDLRMRKVLEVVTPSGLGRCLGR